MRADFGFLESEVLRAEEIAGVDREEEGIGPEETCMQSLTSFILVPLHSAFYGLQ